MAHSRKMNSILYWIEMAFRENNVICAIENTNGNIQDKTRTYVTVGHSEGIPSQPEGKTTSLLLKVV